MDGVRSAVISLAYLPPGLLSILVTSGRYIPSFLLLIPASDRAEDVFPGLVFIAVAVLIVGLTAGMVLLMIGGRPLPIALCRLADEGRLGAAFAFGELFRAVKRDPIG